MHQYNKYKRKNKSLDGQIKLEAVQFNANYMTQSIYNNLRLDKLNLK